MSKFFVMNLTGRSPTLRQTVHATAKGAVDHVLKTVGPFYRDMDREVAVALIEGKAHHNAAYFFVKDPVDGGRYYGVTYVAITPAEVMP